MIGAPYKERYQPVQVPLYLLTAAAINHKLESAFSSPYEVMLNLPHKICEGGLGA